MGEVKAPIQDFYERSAIYEELKQDLKNPKLSKSRRIKYLHRLPYLQYIKEFPLSGITHYFRHPYDR
jgi:hypothetical protein